MANTYADYTGDGSETDFAITFDYIKTAHVAVEINDGPAGGTNKWVRKTLTSDYTVVTSPAKKVVFNSAPANLVKVRVLRDSDANTGIVDFANGSVLTETELDNSYQHNRYLAEEAEEGKTGGALVKNETSGQFDADALRLENLADPNSDDDAVNKGYADNRYVDVAGDTMTGALNLVDPTADDHAAKKKYVDDQDALQVTKSGDTMSGDLNMGSNKITNLADPTVDADAANKNYVDDTITTSLATGSPPPGVQLATAQIEDDAITYAKLQNVASNNVLLGNDNGTGVDVQELTATEARTLLNVEDGAEVNVQSDWNEADANSDAFIQNKPTIPSNSDDLTEGTTNLFNQTHSGDVTGSTALTIANDAVTFAKMQNINTAKVIGRTTASSGDPEEVSILDEDTMTSNSDTALATQQSIKAYVDAQTVSKYNSGWQTSFGGTTVADAASITVTHNLGTTDVTWSMFANASASDTGASSIHGHDVFTSGRFGALVKNLTSNTITFELAQNGYSKANGSGATTTESFTGDYVKVVVVG